MRLSKKDLVKKLYKRNPFCGLCGAPLETEFNKYLVWIKEFGLPKKEKTVKRRNIDISIDHICPKSHLKLLPWGIKNHPLNLQLAHRKCNTEKGNALIISF